MILIYDDYVFNHGNIWRALKECCPSHKIAFCDASDISNGILNADVRLLVMPGGADLYNCEKLNGRGNKLIREYVHQGGAYLGICAGAYYGCKTLDWAVESNTPINGSRELAFFDGAAVGPIKDFIEDGDVTKSWENAVAINVGEHSYTVRYAAGPIFVVDGETKFDILATYTDLDGTPPAIIKTKHGNGTIVLCSPHIETYGDALLKQTYNHLNPSHDREEAAALELAPTDSTLFKHILSHLLETL